MKILFSTYAMAWMYVIQWRWPGKRLEFARYYTERNYRSRADFIQQAREARCRYLRNGRFREFRKHMAQRHQKQKEIFA